MSAPDRIWAMPSDDGWMAPYCGNAPHDGSTEYVRADLCDSMQDERVKRLVEASEALLEKLDEQNDGNLVVSIGLRRQRLRAALRALEGG